MKEIKDTMKTKNNKKNGAWALRSRRCFQYSAVAAGVLGMITHSWAADYFDPSFLDGFGGGDSSKHVDLSLFSEQGGVAEGKYLVMVYMNGNAAGSYDLAFKKNSHGKIVPQLTPAFLGKLGVKVDQLADMKALPPEQPIDDLSALIPDAFTKLNLNQLRLDISVPQIAMQPNYANWQDPSLWEDGITALVSNYNISAGRTKNSSNYGVAPSDTNVYTSLYSRFSFGAWRLHNTYSYNYSDNSGGNQSRQSFNNTYLSRIVVPLRATLTMGEIYSGGDVLDGVQLRGVRLKSDDQMLPSQLRGFAPAITGIASSNARVTVRQNGHVTYETYVAPGPFSINDINQNGLSGDYDVTVTEADGTERQFIVPYSSLPMMLRPGGWNYDLASGHYDGGYTDGSKKAPFMMASGAYGFPQNYTLYGGTLLSKDYQSFVIGAGVSLGQIGAVSTDITTSSAHFQDSTKQQGQSYRLRYSKSMLSTGTTVDLTALRYASENYYSFSEFNSQGYRLNDGVNPWILERRRSSFQTSLSQDLEEWGTLNLRATRDDYWNSDKTRTSLSAGYSNSYKLVSYGVNYNIDQIKSDRNNSWPENRQISFNVSVPFNFFNHDVMNTTTMYTSSSITHDNQGRTQNNIGVSGAFPDNDISYSLSQGWGNQGQESNSNASLNYQGSKGNINTGYSYSSSTQTANVNLNGGVVVHSGGVTLARTLSDAVALVHTPGAEGVSLNNGHAVTDRWGYAISPYLNNFQRNNIGIDPTTLPEGVDITQSNVNVYPTPGSVVRVKFATRIGLQVLLSLTTQEGVVPFGAIATLVNTKDETDTPETVSSIVGDMGQVYLTGLPETGSLTVKWGSKPNQQCVANFDLTHLKDQKNKGLAQAHAQCRPVTP